MTTITAEMVRELREKTGAAMMACKKALVQTEGDLSKAVDVLRKAGEAKAAERASKTAAEGRIVIAIDKSNQTAFMVETNSETDFVARDENFRGFGDIVAEKGLGARAKTVEQTMAVNVDGQTLETMRLQLFSKIGENIQVRRVILLESPGCVGYYIHGDRIGVLVALDQNNTELAKDIAMHIAASRPKAINPEDVDADIVAKEREIYSAQAETSGKPKDIINKMVDGRVNKFLKEVSLTSQPFVKNPDVTVADLLKQNKAKVLSFVRFEVGEGIEKETQNFADEVMAQIKGKD